MRTRDTLRRQVSRLAVARLSGGGIRSPATRAACAAVVAAALTWWLPAPASAKTPSWPDRMSGELPKANFSDAGHYCPSTGYVAHGEWKESIRHLEFKYVGPAGRGAYYTLADARGVSVSGYPIGYWSCGGTANHGTYSYDPSGLVLGDLLVSRTSPGRLYIEIPAIWDVPGGNPERRRVYLEFTTWGVTTKVNPDGSIDVKVRDTATTRYHDSSDTYTDETVDIEGRLTSDLWKDLDKQLQRQRAKQEYNQTLASCIPLFKYIGGSGFWQRDLLVPVTGPFAIPYADEQGLSDCYQRARLHYYSELELIDPADPNYLSVALPPTLARTPGTKVCEHASQSLRARCKRRIALVSRATQSVARLANLAEAMVATLNRLTTAELASSADGRAIQGAVLRAYFGEYLDLARAVDAADARLAQVAAHLPNRDIKLSKTLVGSVQELLRKGKLPKKLRRALAHDGISPAKLSAADSAALGATSATALNVVTLLRTKLLPGSDRQKLTAAYHTLGAGDLKKIVQGLATARAVTPAEHQLLEHDASAIQHASSTQGTRTAVEKFIADAKAVGGQAASLLRTAATALLG